ncbi:MAG: LysE family transporter [Tepidisphaeraceae bacterium]
MELFWSGFLVSLSLCLDLGLVNVAAMRAGVQAGAVCSFALGAGSCFGDLFYAILALLGVSALLGFPAVRWCLWLGGSAILMYFTLKMFRDFLCPEKIEALSGAEKADKQTAAVCFVQGFGIALASPSAMVWFASIGGAVIATTAQADGARTWLFFCGFFCSGLLWSLFVAIVSAQGRRLGVRFIRGFALLSAAAFAWLAVKVFLAGYRSLVIH